MLKEDEKKAYIGETDDFVKRINQHLSKKGFDARKPKEQYLGFELANDQPLHFKDVELTKAIIKGIANRTADSYFTTLKELFGFNVHI